MERKELFDVIPEIEELINFAKFEKEFLKLKLRLEELKKDKNIDFISNIKEIKKAVLKVLRLKGK